MFWDTMALWQKMLLVLAGGIAATFVFGFSKLIQQKMRLRKHAKRQEEQKAHLEQIRNSRPVIQLNKDEIPFGIRAIEAGIEVEGVVISRPGTPFSLPGRSQAGSTTTLAGADGSTKVASVNGSRTSLGSPLPSPIAAPPRPVFPPSTPLQPSVLRKASPRVYQPSPYINMPQQAHMGSSSGRSSLSSLDSQGSSSRHNSGEFSPAPSTPNSFQSSTDFHVEPAYARSFVSSRMGKHELEGTLAKLEGAYEFQTQRTYSAPDLPTLTSEGSSSNSSSNSTSPSSSPPDVLSPFLQPVFEGQLHSGKSIDSPFDFQFPFRNRPGIDRASMTPSDYRADSAHSSLSMLDLHRMSHAAEVGQLHSRKRSHLHPGSQFSRTNSRDASSLVSLSYSELEQQILQDGRFDFGRPLSSSTDGAEEQGRLSESQQWVLEALEGTGITKSGDQPQLSFEPDIPAYMMREPESGSLEERLLKRLSLTLTGNPEIDETVIKRLSLTLATTREESQASHKQISLVKQSEPKRRRLQKRRTNSTSTTASLPRVAAEVAV